MLPRLFAITGLVVATLAIMIPSAHADTVTAAGHGCAFRVVGHRGTDVGVTRNNTLPAFRQAVSDGADVIEMDLRRTKPDSHGRGTWIINHDATISGHTITKTSYAALKRLRPDLATFSSVSKWAGTTQIELEVEFKPSTVTAGSIKYVLAVLSRDGLSKRTTITSFKEPVLKKIQPLAGKVRLGLIAASPVEPTTARAFASVVMVKHTGLTAAYVKAAHTAGLQVEAYTLDLPTDFTIFAGYGVDGIVTDKAAGLVDWCTTKAASAS
jgi:glycerophosphoryl diester phosphodiesterase